jgi:hypothetical protein
VFTGTDIIDLPGSPAAVTAHRDGAAG